MKPVLTQTLRLRALGLVAGALALASSTSLFAQAVRYDAAPGGKVRIEGTSSIHDWDMNGSIIGGFMEVDPAFPDGGSLAPKAEVRIPIRTLKSYQKKMDEVAQEAMEMAKFPNIEYKLQAIKAKGPAKDGKTECDATGVLTIHGTSVTNTMPVVIEKLDGGAKLKVGLKLPLKMTTFGVKPPAPSLAMGMIKTGDDITVIVDWVLGRKEAAK